MKQILLMIAVVALVGCGKQEQTDEELTLEEKAVGTHELETKDGDAFRYVLLEHGIVEGYLNGKKVSEAKWEVVDDELNISVPAGFILIFRINKDGTITGIADIRNGKRTAQPKGRQMTFKKIK